jgi:hypothetical protein
METLDIAVGVALGLLFRDLLLATLKQAWAEMFAPTKAKADSMAAGGGDRE